MTVVVVGGCTADNERIVNGVVVIAVDQSPKEASGPLEALGEKMTEIKEHVVEAAHDVAQKVSNVTVAL